LARLASTLLVLALLGGTAAAFAVTEELKLEESPITRPLVDELFSPVSEATTGTADVGFTLREADRMTLTIVGGDGEEVRTLARELPVEPGAIAFSWDGRDDAGAVVPDASYYPRVHLERAHRTIRLPNAISVDTAPPRIVVGRMRPRVVSPDGDGRADFTRVRYRVNEIARALLLVDGRQAVRGRLRRSTGVLRWFGKAFGKRLRAGRYRIELRAEDRAGNLSAPTATQRVRIRYVQLAREVIRVRSRARFRVGVSTDAERVRWLLRGRRGVSRRRLLRLRAPARPGRYTLFVSANRHADKVRVIVTRAR
jgi:FlgD Ig-like domain